MRKCPRCGLLSPDKSLRCECGFHFDIDDEAAVRREHEQWRQSARAHLVGGLVLVILGIVTSLVSYFQAVEKGGSHFVWTGVMICGVVLAIRSYARLRAIRAAERPLDR